MNEDWWDRPVCWICDGWWWMLLLIVSGLTAFSSRAYWWPDGADLCFAGRSSVPLQRAIPATWGDIDVVFAFDQSSSMWPVIAGAKDRAHDLMTTLAARFWNERFGLIGFSDYVDVPYARYQTITEDRSSMAAAIDQLRLYNGGDIPEAYGRAMYEAYADPELGWSPTAKRYLVIFGDSIPHDVDPGRDGQPGTADDLEIQAVVAQLQAQAITLIFVANPGTDVTLAPMDRWQAFADTTVGTVISCAEGGVP